MKLKKTDIIIVSLILFYFGIGIYLYPQMPEKMASHWNIKGEVDGYLSKFWGLFLMPLLSIGILLLYLIIPKVDPLKKNIEKFRKYFDGFIVLIISFLFYLYLLTIFWNLGIRFNMTQFLVPAFAVLFYYCGILVENAKRNWFIGIRTPWTLSSEKVWDKTHRLGGKLFKICGLIILFGIFLPNYTIPFLFIPIFFVIGYTVVYSYFEYQKEIK